MDTVLKNLSFLAVDSFLKKDFYKNIRKVKNSSNLIL